jgi:hypothetical protein
MVASWLSVFQLGDSASDFSYSPLAMSWTIFFCGCKRIAKTFYGYDETYEGGLGTLLDWHPYHGVIYKFSIRHWRQTKITA